MNLYLVRATLAGQQFRVGGECWPSAAVVVASAQGGFNYFH